MYDGHQSGYCTCGVAASEVSQFMHTTRSGFLPLWWSNILVVQGLLSPPEAADINKEDLGNGDGGKSVRLARAALGWLQRTVNEAGY